ncbi:Pectinesterase inhibitor [Corchorus olitorius]|uniref:Pectinesterase inhibitor n=1 Tax=Corchorus olitorius TaxID=93759 RepID=A0A1R3GJT9_9ROSI|nr:Pectinesterase inhibitor [Corchorus olitorius]
MVSFARFLLIATSLAIILFINPSAAKSRPILVTNADIKTMCSKTEAHSLCLRLLTNQANDLHELAMIPLYLALKSASQTRQAISPLIRQAKNYKETQAYALCSQNYSEALDSVKLALLLLSKHDYRGLRVAALSAVVKAKACGVRVATFINPFSPFLQKNGDFKNYCNILWVITNRLLEYTTS